MGEFSSSEPQHMGLQLPNRNKLQRKERGGGGCEKVQWNEFCLVQIFNFSTGL